MYSYMIGKVTLQESVYIVLELNNIGYKINVANPYSYMLNEEYKIYLYQQIKEDEHNLFGFKSLEELELFLKLISVKGVGPKIALPMFATGSINGITDAIERENVLYLTKFPKVGERVAKQIILDLKGKLGVVSGYPSDTKEELIEVLKGLGYKEKDYKGIINKVSSDKNIEEQVKEALRLLLK